jgi:hypothetical protein
MVIHKFKYVKLASFAGFVTIALTIVLGIFLTGLQLWGFLLIDICFLFLGLLIYLISLGYILVQFQRKFRDGFHSWGNNA